jgi:hypothetical protein
MKSFFLMNLLSPNPNYLANSEYFSGLLLLGSLKVLPVTYLKKLSLLKVAKVAGELFSLPLVVYQPSILIGEVLLPSEASDLPTSAFQQILKGRLWLYPSRSAH